ncbi:MAG: radical SAM protein [Elusimicrobiota bacterium]
MKLNAIINSAVSILKVKAGKRIPVAVRIQLTNRCDHKCLYCDIWQTKSEEMTTEQVFELIRQLKTAGTKKISFSGGEPLLRSDIGEIIDYCRALDISPEMNSRGAGIETKVHKIKNLDLLKVSINGDEQTHDFLSGRKGAFTQSIKAIETAIKHGIKTTIATTLTKQNIEQLDFILGLAKKYKTIVAFQPLKKFGYGTDNIESLYPEKSKYQKALSELIELKQKGNGYMRNSLLGLKHIFYWPDYPKLHCAAGKLFCIVDTDGTVYPCDRICYKTELPNWLKVGFKNAFANLPEVRCSGCGFCGSLELSFLLAFKFGTIKSVLNVIKKGGLPCYLTG